MLQNNFWRIIFFISYTPAFSFLIFWFIPTFTKWIYQYVLKIEILKNRKLKCLIFFQKLGGKGKKVGLTAFLFPSLLLSFASLTLLSPNPSSVLYILSPKGPSSFSSLHILVLKNKRIFHLFCIGFTITLAKPDDDAFRVGDGGCSKDC